MSTVIIRDLDALKRNLAPHLTKARKAIVFGSVARGDADEWSDLDLVIVTKTSHPFLEVRVDSSGMLEFSSRGVKPWAPGSP